MARSVADSSGLSPAGKKAAQKHTDDVKWVQANAPTDAYLKALANFEISPYDTPKDYCPYR